MYPTTTIEFALPKRSTVKLTVLNLLGQELTTLVAEEKEAGVHRIVWNAEKYPSGVYLYRFEANGFVATRKMILLK
ncbi:MAG: T9SS type A sorting domain-containing protein [Candidatus Jorgensenbacteria bacterium]